MACTPPDGMVLVTNATGCVIFVVICVPYMPPAHTITGDCPPDLDRRELRFWISSARRETRGEVYVFVCTYSHTSQSSFCSTTISTAFSTSRRLFPVFTSRVGLALCLNFESAVSEMEKFEVRPRHR